MVAPGSYSHVAIIPAGRQVHLSGQVALDVSGLLVGRGDLAAQAEQAFLNVAKAFEGVGIGMESIFKLTIYVVDLSSERADLVREVRKRYFAAGHYPTATMIGISALVDPEFLIEIEAIGYAG